MDSFFGFFLILLIIYETATTTTEVTTTYSTDITSETAVPTEHVETSAAYTSPATTDITSETAVPTEHVETSAAYTSPATTDIPTTADFELVPVTAAPTSLPGGSHSSLKAEPDHGTESTTNAPNLGPRSGNFFDKDSEISTTHSDMENSTHINLGSIKDDVLQTLKSTTEINKKLEGGSTSKPAEPLSKDTTAKRTVTLGEAAAILIGSLIVAVALICVSKIVYNRYKRKTYDVAQNTIELGNP